VSVDLRSVLVAARAGAHKGGIASLCTAHPGVIEVALAHGQEAGTPVLIEATCNQVNQDGGYTGMRPADFRRLVEDAAARTGFDTARLLLGGDHLGPSPWRHLPAVTALAKAEEMTAAYVDAGFEKLHLDTSMGCAGEARHLDHELVAERASRLVEVAESVRARAQGPAPVYVVGTEVPTPGGAVANDAMLDVTTPASVTETLEAHRSAFARRGLDAAFERVIGLVVQPGVEFGDEEVVHYDRERACPLITHLATLPSLVFEAHSTDYQTVEGLIDLVTDGFAIVKVGPWLTFALREALYGLDHIACELHPAERTESLQTTMERVMRARPEYWEHHYIGSATERRVKRHFSYSDRIRYYWSDPEAVRAVHQLVSILGATPIPPTLVSQYLHGPFAHVASGHVPATAPVLLAASVRAVLDTYAVATRTPVLTT
jgi:D-tagatose-bisphosphate aldolase class II non-catalytic subunit